MAKKRIKIKNDVQRSVSRKGLNNAKEHSYITFNFSFLSSNSDYNLSSRNLTDNHKHLFLKRLMELSQKDMIELTANTDKKLGLEKITKFNGRDKINSLSIHSEFTNSSRLDSAGSGYWIFRLCPNNNPYPSRVIGKLIKDVFYVMYIDCNHDLYSKRK